MLVLFLQRYYKIDKTNLFNRRMYFLFLERVSINIEVDYYINQRL